MRRSSPRNAPLLLAILITMIQAPIGFAQGRRAPVDITWDNLESHIDRAVQAGFCGAVLVVHNGETVFSKGFGLANRAAKTPNTTDTIFGIGSTPIDFTRAGILLLAQRGKLDLGDPITKYFDNVPADKQAITIEHLMTGRSGLQNFHDLPGDANPDHTWIDRDEAMRRIFDQKLLFEPGQGQKHSHSAWGVLAAVIEIVSGQSYQQFVLAELFEPAGMESTGFFGTMYPMECVAIGYGDRTSGEVNAPPYWGRTSWLVMGSGGMVSTVNDLYRWNQAIRQGKLLEPEWAAKYWAPPGAVLDGGDMFGFEIMYTEGPDSLFYVITNESSERNRVMMDLGESLAQLVTAASRPKYSLGVSMGIHDNGAVVIEQVVPGSAAEAAGLREGDFLLSLNGQPLNGDPLDAMMPFLTSGDTMKFTVQRDGKELKIDVKPRKRK